MAGLQFAGYVEKVLCMPVDRFIRKLEMFAPLSDPEKRLIKSAIENSADYEAAEDILRRGESTHYVHLLFDGWAGRYTDLPNGERQITAYLLPGDLCNRHISLLREMDHSVGALSPCHVAAIREEKLAELIHDHANIARALQLCSIVDEAISREWLVSLGRRSAEERISHLLCEMFSRLSALGMTEDSSFDLPLSQGQLADMMGLSVVHMNRSLRRLQAARLIDYSGGRMFIIDRNGLIRRAGFDSSYLRQERAGEKLARAL